MNTGWTIRTGGTDLTPDYATGDWNNLTRGESTTFQFGFNDKAGWESLQEFADYAGKFVLHRGTNGDVRYTERLPAGADTNTLLLGIEPNSELQASDVTGVWGVVSSGSDERTTGLTNYEYRIGVTVLAEFGEYANHATALSALEQSL